MPSTNCKFIPWRRHWKQIQETARSLICLFLTLVNVNPNTQLKENTRNKIPIQIETNIGRKWAATPETTHHWARKIVWKDRTWNRSGTNAATERLAKFSYGGWRCYPRSPSAWSLKLPFVLPSKCALSTSPTCSAYQAVRLARVEDATFASIWWCITHEFVTSSSEILSVASSFSCAENSGLNGPDVSSPIILSHNNPVITRHYSPEVHMNTGTDKLKLERSSMGM